jgi:hypothetical protein
MEDYPANSRAAKQKAEKPRQAPQEKKVEKVVTGNVIQRKKSFSTKLKETFVGDSRTVGQYIVRDVIIPAAKEVLHDVVNSYMDRMLFHDSRGPVRRSRGTSSSTGPRINYGSTSSIRRDPREEQRRNSSRNSDRSKQDIGDIILEQRVEAEEVIDRMNERINEYGQVSVADLYDMIDVTSVFTDNKWGWYNIEGARARYTRDGYLLDLPKPIIFD